MVIDATEHRHINVLARGYGMAMLGCLFGVNGWG